MTGRYVVMDIGCLECGSPSKLVDVTTMQGVERAGATLVSDLPEADWAGHGVVVAFPIPEALAMVLQSAEKLTMWQQNHLSRKHPVDRAELAILFDRLNDLYASYATMLYAEQVDDDG